MGLVPVEKFLGVKSSLEVGAYRQGRNAHWGSGGGVKAQVEVWTWEGHKRFSLRADGCDKRLSMQLRDSVNQEVMPSIRQHGKEN